MKQNDKLLHYQKNMEYIWKFCLMDDDFMSKVFEDKGCASLLLQIILEKQNLKVVLVRTQETVSNLQGRSVRLDILAVDEENVFYNIEVQCKDGGAVPKRARYNSSLIDANITEPGDDYEKLPETYIIFITKNDVRGGGLPIYHIDRMERETGKEFGDKSHIIYVNGKIKDNTRLGKLMHDFECRNPDDMNYKILADRTRYFKENEKGVQTMCEMMETMRAEAAEQAAKEGRKEGRKEGIRALAETLREMNIEPEKIIKKIEEKFNLSFEEAKAYVE